MFIRVSSEYQHVTKHPSTMTHLQASLRYLALLLCFVPVLALAQQPMTIGVKGYATGLTFKSWGNFGMTAQEEPDVSFSNTFTTGIGIYFERKSPLGFQWALEVGRLFEKHVAHIEDLESVQSADVPIYIASAQFGYRLSVKSGFSLAAFTGATYQFVPGLIAGIGQHRTNGPYEFDIFQSFSNVLYLPLRLDASWAMSDHWSLSGGVQFGLPLDVSFQPNGYYIRVENTQNPDPPKTANYIARPSPAIFSLGIHYHIQ